MNNEIFLVSLITASVLIFIFTWIDNSVVGTKKTTSSSRITITVEAPSSVVMKNVSTFVASQYHYRIDYYSPEDYHIVLNQEMSFKYFGFLYSIKVIDRQGKSDIVIGISSKVSILNPWALKNEKSHLLSFTNAIRANLYGISTEIESVVGLQL